MYRSTFLYGLLVVVLRLFFRLIYGPLAWTYDVVAWTVSRGRWKEWGAAALSWLPEGPVLELAHGPGHLLVCMARQGLQPVGLDLSPQMSALARRRLRRAAVPLRLVQARAERLPFRDIAFRAVVATFPAEFIMDPSTAREAARVLVSGGTVVIVPTAIPGGRNPVAVALRFLYRVTGQSAVPPERAWQSWQDAGFSLRTQWQMVGADRVLIVQGTKCSPSTSIQTLS